MTSPKRSAVLFDIDGTLIDSNYLHVQAWSEALESLERPTDDWRIHRAIGLDSAKLKERLLGKDADKIGEKASSAHSERYEPLTARLKPFGGARELLEVIANRGVQVVLATSAPPAELKHLLRALDSEAVISHVTSAEDAETAKPDPEIMHVALTKAQVPPERAFMIGDSVWDGEAAARAKLRFIGVRSGGTSAAELTEAGAIVVYDDVAALLEQLDGSPLAELWA